MHAIVQIITEHFPTPELIDEIMKPYEHKISEDEKPEFVWESYFVKDLFVVEHGDPDEVGNCKVLIDKQRKVVSKYQWDSEMTADKIREFKKAVKESRNSLKETDWITIIECHW